MNIKPGDLIFYPDDGKWSRRIFVWLQRLGGQMGSWAGKPITHVAMISSEPDLIIEMKWPRPKFRTFVDDTREKIVMRPRADEAFKTRAIYWCYFNVDKHYSFLEMVLGRMGLRNCQRVCSAWIANAYKEAGFPLVGVGDKLVSPNELITSDKLDLIEG